MLNSYPHIFYSNKAINNKTQMWYMQNFCLFVKRKQWTGFFSYLKQDDLNEIEKCYTQ